MALKSDMKGLLAGMKTIQGVARATQGWPDNFETLPCIAIEEASNTPHRFADDREHITEIEYYIRVFSYKAEEKDRLADLVDDFMTERGYTRTLAYDNNEADVRMKALRYQKLF